MHINIARYKRRVYVKINSLSLVPVNEVDHAEDYEWVYRYGSNGRQTSQILEPLLNKDIFTNDYDRRISYE